MPIGIVECDAVSIERIRNPAQVFMRTVPESEDAHQVLFGAGGGALRNLKMTQRLRVARDALV